jgi:hypothetical protein
MALMGAMSSVSMACLKLSDLLQGHYVNLELGPTCKPAETRDLELRIDK